MKHLLIVDDERGTRESLYVVFSNQYRVSLAANAKQALEALAGDPVDAVFLDIIMPDVDGLSLLNQILQAHPEMPVIMVSAAAGVKPAIKAIRMGAYDYVSKPFELEEVRTIAARALQSATLKRKVSLLQSEIEQEFPVNGIVGESSSFRKALADTRKAAETDATVLFIGESGTGKELFARYLHGISERQQEPFCPVHCAALPQNLMETELFGYEKGAFTGANKRKLGLIDMAGSGTLFFDEVSEMAPAVQVKLLRVLQEREFMRVGGTQRIHTNARIAAASATDLREAAETSDFRQDLYYRLSVVPIQLPPLRERLDDIPLLAYYFLSYFRKRMNVRTRDINPDALDAFRRYPWPGNIRELRNIIERMLVLHGKRERICLEDLPNEFNEQRQPAVQPLDGPLTDAVDAFEADLIRRAMEENDGIQTRAAKQLGITRRMLKYRIDKLGLDFQD